MDIGSDSDDEFSGASLETSPQDNKIPNSGAKYNNSLNGHMYDTGSDRNHLESLGGRGGRFPVARPGFVFDESSDSITSSEVNSTPSRKTYVPDAYNSHVHLRPNEETENQNFSIMGMKLQQQILKRRLLLGNSLNVPFTNAMSVRN